MHGKKNAKEKFARNLVTIVELLKFGSMQEIINVNGENKQKVSDNKDVVFKLNHVAMTNALSKKKNAIGEEKNSSPNFTEDVLGNQKEKMQNKSSVVTLKKYVKEKYVINNV